MGNGANGNYRLADRLHARMLDIGPQTVAELKEWYNNGFQEEQRKRVAERRKTLYNSASSNQITGVLIRSPLFAKAGETMVAYPSWTRKASKMQKANVTLWEALPVAMVVDKMLDENGQLKQHRIRKSFPQTVKIELKERGLL
jgi:hypothetical protein